MKENNKIHFNNIHISFPIVIPAIVVYLLFGFVFFYIIIPSFENVVMEQKKEMIRDRALFAWDIIAQYYEDVENGGLPLAEAQTIAKRFLRNIQYGKENTDYFWINDDHPNFIMHPYRQDIVGKDIDTISDSNIRQVLYDINAVVESQGEGFLEYMWQRKDDHTNVIPKISYVKQFSPWGWTVGTGMYIDDVNEEIAALKDRFNVSAGVILFLTGIMVVFLVYNNIIEENKINKAKKALQQSEKKYRDLVESANSIILRMDANGIITFINTYAQKFFGFKENELVGKSLVGTIMAPSESFNRLADEFPENPEKFINTEFENIRSDGEKVQIAWTNKAVYDEDGNIQEVLCIGNDITEIRQNEEKLRQQQMQLIQADKMATLAILVSGVAHEINNPNHFIRGNTSVLRSFFQNFHPVLDFYHKENGDFEINGIPYSELHEQISEMFNDIQSGSDRIQFIVQELRDYVRFKPGEMIESIDYNAVIRSAIILVTNMINKSTHNFSVQYSSEIPLIKGNFQRLEQVVINILQNACQAIDDPSQGIQLSTAYFPDDDVIICTLHDEGIGMSDDVLEHVTDPFFTTRRESGSTGLGLSISSKIIAEHGGTISFQSSPGRGTTVYITLPVHRTEKDFKNIGISDYIDSSTIVRMDTEI